jgi:hypothetical protein
MFKKYIHLLKKYIKWGVWRLEVCTSYIWDARFLKVKQKLEIPPTQNERKETAKNKTKK